MPRVWLKLLPGIGNPGSLVESPDATYDPQVRQGVTPEDRVQPQTKTGKLKFSELDWNIFQNIACSSSTNHINVKRFLMSKSIKH